MGTQKVSSNNSAKRSKTNKSNQIGIHGEVRNDDGDDGDVNGDDDDGDDDVVDDEDDLVMTMKIIIESTQHNG